MQITTKFKLNQDVYFLTEKGVMKNQVYKIQVELCDSNKSIIYTFYHENYKGASTKFKEEDLFETKESLIDALINAKVG